MLPCNCLSHVYFFRGEIPKGDDLLVKEDLIKLKRCIYAAEVTMSKSSSSSYPVLVFKVLQLSRTLGRQHLATPHTRSP